jgi:integrase
MAQRDSLKLERTKYPGIYKRSDGPYIVRWKDRGKSRKRLFRTLALAREFKGKLDGGQRQTPSRERVADYYDRWIDSYRGRTSRGLEDTTRELYRRTAEHHLLPYPIARERVRDVTSHVVTGWFTELEQAGATPNKIRLAKAVLAAMLADAAQAGDIAANPVAGCRYIPSPEAKRRHPKRKRRALTAADVAAILDAMPERWRAFFAVLAQTGLRVGELLGLTWRYVHLGDDPHILVAEQVYKGERKELKTDASLARVPLSPSMAAWLAQLGPGDPDVPVFPSTAGTPLSYGNIYNRVLRPALIDAGIAVKVGDKWDYQGVAFHAFRKACGSLLLAHGKDLKQIQGWLRHAQLSTTLNVYIHEVDGGLGGGDVWEHRQPQTETDPKPRNPRRDPKPQTATTP